MYEYKTLVLDYHPAAKDMAREIEDAANAMDAQGYELATMSVTGAAKAILVFRRPRA